MVAVVVLVVVLIGSGAWELMHRPAASHLSTNRTTAQASRRQRLKRD